VEEKTYLANEYISGNCISNVGKFATNITVFAADVVANVPSEGMFKECMNNVPTCVDLVGKEVWRRLRI